MPWRHVALQKGGRAGRCRWIRILGRGEKMGFAERAGWALHPKGMLRREQMRAESAMLAAQAEEAAAKAAEASARAAAVEAKRNIMENYFHGMGVSNSGYSHGGASHGNTWDLEYDSESGSAKRDIEENRKTLRERTRDLAMNTSLGAAAVNSVRTNVVGAGLVPVPRIDYEFLGISREEAKKLEDSIKREFRLWASSAMCDNNEQNNFYELQQIAFSDWLKNGEEFVLIRYAEELPDMPYRLRLKLVEADRISSPDSFGEYDGFDRKLKNGNIVMNGVEIEKSGRVAAYYVASDYPGEWGIGTTTWERIPKRGKRTGNPNILHVFNGERADQYRGVPFLAPVIKTLKQLSRYSEAEIMAAVVNSLFTIFITTETGNDLGGFGGLEEDEEGLDGAGRPDDKFRLGSGIINELKEGEDVHPVESTHPSGNFDSFVSAMCSQLGAALEISPEVLLKKFGNNFSASKGALNETWQAFRMRRGWFINDFCQPVYELWFNEAVSKGRIRAPGYFNNPLIKAAYANAKWNGPAQGYLNPMQEVNAAVTRMDNGLSTHEDECASMSGGSFEDNVRTLLIENSLLRKANGISGNNYDEEETGNDEN